MSETYLPQLREQLLVAAGQRAPVRRRRSSLRALALGSGAAAIAATVAFILGAGSDPQAAANNVRSDGVLLRNYFAVFGEPSQAADPANPFDDVPARSPRFELQGASVHRLQAPGSVWVAATAKTICISAATPGSTSSGGACARPAQVLDGGLFTFGRDKPTGDAVRDAQVNLAGLLPDGVHAITFHLRDGGQVTRDAGDNAIATRLPDMPVRGTFRDENGTGHSIDFGGG